MTRGGRGKRDNKTTRKRGIHAITKEGKRKRETAGEGADLRRRGGGRRVIPWQQSF